MLYLFFRISVSDFKQHFDYMVFCILAKEHLTEEVAANVVSICCLWNWKNFIQFYTKWQPFFFCRCILLSVNSLSHWTRFPLNSLLRFGLRVEENKILSYKISKTMHVSFTSFCLYTTLSVLLTQFCFSLKKKILVMLYITKF